MDYKITYNNLSGSKNILDVTVKKDWDDCSFLDWDDFRNPDILMDIRDHRDYKFCKDLDIDWYYLDIDFSGYSEEELEEDWDYIHYREEMEKIEDLKKDYYIFGLDFFNHTIISFSLSEKRIDLGYYNMDRSRNIGMILVKKSDSKDREDAMKKAMDELDCYNRLINGEIYGYHLESENDDGVEYIGSMGGFLDIESMDEYIREDIENYMDRLGIEYDPRSIEIIEK